MLQSEKKIRKKTTGRLKDFFWLDSNILQKSILIILMYLGHGCWLVRLVCLRSATTLSELLDKL